jgi:hypothetical protein
VARHRKSGNSGVTIERITHIIASLFNAVPRAAQTIDTIGSIVGFRRWSKTLGVRVYATRIRLWEQMILPKLLVSTSPVSIFEFGVAYGEASRWWLSKLPSQTLKYEGFDLFTGLPTAWRNMPAGAFNANGQTPQIDDGRVTWFVGDVGETIKQVDWNEHIGQRLFIFDLDLFSPSLAVWEVIQDKIKPGDLLYFDEAFDIDERLLLQTYVLPGSRFEPLGSSPFGIVLQCNEARQQSDIN